MKFQHLEYLAGLLVLPLLILLFLRMLQWKKKTGARIGDPGLVQQLVKTYSPARTVVKFGLACLALIFLILGLANLRSRGTTENFSRSGVDVMIVLDVSKSMLAQDVKPSRLEKAKQLLFKLLDRLENDRVGLILFAGRAYLQMPLTTDHGAARMYIQEAGPELVPSQGTVISDALLMANSAFNSNEHKYKAVVLISDGEDHNPEALKTARQLADDGVMINTVGIGSPDGSTIIDPVTKEIKKDEKGDIVISKLNEKELTEISDASNGLYLRLDNLDDALITLSQRLNGIEKRALADSEFVNYKNYFQWFLGAALLLLLVEFFLSERKPKSQLI
jgi:Ca-activated chloride channel homolog